MACTVASQQEGPRLNSWLDHVPHMSATVQKHPLGSIGDSTQLLGVSERVSGVYVL